MMALNRKQLLIERILKRKKYHIEWTSEGFIIELSKSYAKWIQISLWAAIGFFVLLLLINFAFFKGNDMAEFLIYGAIALVGFVNFKMRQSENADKTLEFGQNAIYYKEKFHRKEFVYQEIQSIYFSIDQIGEERFLGKIYLQKREGRKLKLLEFYGDDLKYLEDDTNKVADFFSEKCSSNSGSM